MSTLNIDWEPEQPQKRIGVAKGKITIPDDIDACNPEIANLFSLNFPADAASDQCLQQSQT